MYMSEIVRVLMVELQTPIITSFYALPIILTDHS